MLRDAIRLTSRDGKPTDLDWELGDEKSQVETPDPVEPNRSRAAASVPGHTQVCESQSDGPSERAVQMVEDTSRPPPKTNNHKTTQNNQQLPSKVAWGAYLSCLQP